MNVDVRLTAMTSSHCSSFITMNRLSLVSPALLTRMSSRPPSALIASSTSLPTCSLLARSQGVTTTRSPSSTFNASSLSVCRPEIATVAPWACNLRAIAPPMPPVAPVTSAVLPVRSNITVVLAGAINAGWGNFRRCGRGGRRRQVGGRARQLTLAHWRLRSRHRKFVISFEYTTSPSDDRTARRCRNRALCPQTG